MRYMGGKSRVSKQIVEVINNAVYGWEKQNLKQSGTSSAKLGGEELTTFVSLFCGSCSIEAKVQAKTKILNDKHSYLIAMWKGIQDGYELPDIITDADYKYIKNNKDEDPCLTGFVGFGCSFGGKWFGGLARNKKGDNYCARANRSVHKDFEMGLKDAQFLCLDYKDVHIPDGSVVYCDPPYANTTGYTTGQFNHEEFWDYMRLISKKNLVLISEQSAPDDFECVWEQEITRTLDHNKENQFKKVEKLFKLKNEMK